MNKSDYLRAVAIGPCTGREVAKRLGLSAWRTGALYVNLHQLEETGLIVSEPLSSGARQYTVTQIGQYNLEQEAPKLTIAVVKRDSWFVKLVKRVWRIW